MFDGAVVKSNGPANREIRHFIRNPNTGLLEDRSIDIQALVMSQTQRDRLSHLVDLVRMRENDGRALTHDGKNDGVFNVVTESEPIEPCVIALKQAGGRTTVKGLVTKAMEQGMIRKYALTTSGEEKWLGTMDGPLARGEYERQTGRDNV